jgi:hypothetical protein
MGITPLVKFACGKSSVRYRRDADVTIDRWHDLKCRFTGTSGGMDPIL